MTKKVALNVVLHVVAWSVFVVLLYLLTNANLRTPAEQSLRNNPYFIFNQVFTNAYLIALFYLNSLVLIPRLLAKKRILLYALIVIGLLVVYLSVPDYVFQNFIAGHPPLHPHPGPPPPGPPRPRRVRIFPFLGSAALFLFIFVISSGAKILQQWFKAERMQEAAEKEKLRTELSLLKSQVNPHFLFNTLNNIYAMAITGSDHTADAVMKLSQIMRYILQEAEHELVPLQKDLDFLQRYIELQQFRLSDKVKLRYQVTGSPDRLRIAPLLLIPFIENAFKYGVSAREQSVIQIEIGIRENVVTLWAENSKHAAGTAHAPDNTGIGINNVRRRLELLYPERHELTITDLPSTFTVTLKITCG